MYKDRAKIVYANKQMMQHDKMHLPPDYYFNVYKNLNKTFREREKWNNLVSFIDGIKRI